MDLLTTEIRVLGSLLEKQHTTPDAYPLTLNSLRLACNQSTNRDPVVQYSEAEVRDALQRLERRGLVRFASGAGSRAAKFRHLLAERLPMEDAEQAVMCVLMLRGSQTPGELKQRGERLHSFADLAEVEQTLAALIGRGLVRSVPRRPGQKEERYLHLLGASEEDAEGQGAPSEAPAEDADRLAGSHADGLAGSGVPEAVEEHLPVGEASEPPADLEPGHDWQRREQEIVDLRERVARLEGEPASLKNELGVA